ncbi:hypothetical protein PCI56_09825 [Plesiomonas shigelloides subsp. oncorhynchi]|nr:hypothetical protein [Plesiomonas shigelloides]
MLVASILTWQSSVHLYNENQQDTQTRIDGMSITVSGDISTWLQGKISAVQAVTPFTKDTSTLIPIWFKPISAVISMTSITVLPPDKCSTAQSVQLPQAMIHVFATGI